MASAPPQSAPFKRRPEEVPLELAGNELLFRTNKMQNLDDVPIASHCAAGGENNRQDSCGNDQTENRHADENGRTRHRNKPVDPGAVIIETGARNVLDQRVAYGGKIRWEASSRVTITRRGTGSSSMSRPVPSQGSNRRAVAARSMIRVDFTPEKPCAIALACASRASMSCPSTGRTWIVASVEIWLCHVAAVD